MSERYIVNIPEGVCGDFSIRKETTDFICEVKEPLSEYTFLYGPNHSIMTDSIREYRECQEFISAARGDVLVAGLGLGVIHEALMENPSIVSVTIVEKFPHVIDLVWDQCKKDSRFRLVQADIYDWIPDAKWDVGWFDSWIGELDYNSLISEKYKSKMTEKYSSVCTNMYFWCHEDTEFKKETT